MLDRVQSLPAAGLIAAVIALGIAGFIVLGDDNSDLPADDTPETVTADDHDDGFELAEESPFSTDGIVTALRTGGWHVDRSGDPLEMLNYSYRTLRLASGNHQIELRLYEANNEEVIDDITADITHPDRYVVFDHIIARIGPVDTGDRRIVDSAKELLEDYQAALRRQHQD